MRRANGESASVNMSRDEVIAYLNDQIQVDDVSFIDIQKVLPNRLINMDEFALFWIDLGFATIAPEGIALSGYKKSKNRTTIAAFIRADGYKFPLVNIGHFNMPRDLQRERSQTDMLYGMQHWRNTNFFRDHSKKAWGQQANFYKNDEYDR